MAASCRSTGVLVELAVGDAHRAGFEYADAEFVRTGNKVRGYVQHSRHKSILPGAYTDDTQMTHAVAEPLVSGEK